ncbi:Uncharacterised protein [Bordetella trematum]|nr:Uncharacterised protein [Bordetella trematum]
MSQAKWDFRIERPIGSDGHWQISYVLLPPDPSQQERRIDVQQHYPAAQTAIDEATRLALIQVADLNGQPPTCERPRPRKRPSPRTPAFEPAPWPLPVFGGGQRHADFPAHADQPGAKVPTP